MRHAPCKILARLAMLVLLGISLAGCAMVWQRPAVRLISQITHSGFAVYTRETDLLLAEPGFAAHLKLVEMLLDTDPHNAQLLLQAVQGFAGYTYAFAETHLEEARGASTAPVAWQTRRVAQLYQRGLRYGLQLLSQQHRDWLQAPALPLEQLHRLLQRLDRTAVPALFWTSFCWGGWLNFARTELETVTMLPRLHALLNHLLSLDETYFDGLPHVLQAVAYAGVPAWMGGNPTQAQQHFGRAAALSQGRLLLVPLLEAQYVAVQTQDRRHFTRLLCDVLQRDAETLFPEQALLNTVAQQRAALLLRRGDTLFLEAGEACERGQR